tara:strand:- start:22319 stop:22615 length:297 start_codon:yes stop_codon:yes gene_type:complete
LEAVAWKLSSIKNEISFCLQINGVNLKNKNKIVRSLEGWRMSGSGYNFKKKHEILLSYREFSSHADFVKWAETFPYPLLEQKPSGKVYKINKRAKNGK